MATNDFLCADWDPDDWSTDCDRVPDEALRALALQVAGDRPSSLTSPLAFGDGFVLPIGGVLPTSGSSLGSTTVSASLDAFTPGEVSGSSLGSTTVSATRVKVNLDLEGSSLGSTTPSAHLQLTFYRSAVGRTTVTGLLQSGTSQDIDGSSAGSTTVAGFLQPAPSPTWPIPYPLAIDGENVNLVASTSGLTTVGAFPSGFSPLDAYPTPPTVSGVTAVSGTLTNQPALGFVNTSVGSTTVGGEIWVSADRNLEGSSQGSTLADGYKFNQIKSGTSGGPALYQYLNVGVGFDIDIRPDATSQSFPDGYVDLFPRALYEYLNVGVSFDPTDDVTDRPDVISQRFPDGDVWLFPRALYEYIHPIDDDPPDWWLTVGPTPRTIPPRTKAKPPRWTRDFAPHTEPPPQPDGSQQDPPETPTEPEPDPPTPGSPDPGDSGNVPVPTSYVLATPSTLANLINSNPQGTTFRLTSGTYSGTFPNKPGNRYIGENASNPLAVTFNGGMSSQGNGGNDYAFTLKGANTFAHLAFTRYRGPNDKRGPLAGNANNIRIDNVYSFENYRTGIDIQGRNWVITRLKAYRNGQYGVAGSGWNNLVKNFEFWENGIDGIPYRYGKTDRGGCKIVLSHYFTFEDGETWGHDDQGLWFDIGNSNYTFRNIYSHDNAKNGLFIEANYGPGLVEGCTIEDCGSKPGFSDNNFTQAGILVALSSNVTVRNNSVSNCRAGITGYQWNHPQYTGAAQGKRQCDPLRNLLVTGNTIGPGITNATAGIGSLSKLEGLHATDPGANNRFRNNTYLDTDGFKWGNLASSLVSYSYWTNTLGMS